MMDNSERQSVIDNATLQFSRFAARGDWHEMGLRHSQDMVKRAIEAAGPLPTELEGEPAARYVEGLIECLAAIILEHQSAYGPMRWLWYLRRLPDAIFRGHLSTTAPYDRGLAEALSWYSTGEDVSRDPQLIAFKADASAFRHSCRYVAATKMLAHLHSMYRRIGKGARVDLTLPTPGWTQSETVRDAILAYDTRHTREGAFHQRGLGLSTVQPDAGTLISRAKSGSWDLVIVTYSEPLWMPVQGPDGAGNITDLSVVARHGLASISIDAILWPYGKERDLNLPWLQTIEPLVILLMALPLLIGRIPWALSSTLQMGYFFARNAVLESLFDRWFPPLFEYLHARAPSVPWSSSFAEWKTRIGNITPSLWPLQAGGVLRAQGEGTLIDVTAASNALVHRAQVDRTASGLANERALSFELQVQELVDDSTWSPSPALTRLRGVTLRRDGRHITDVDAIGSRGNTLLLISCKSAVYDADYDKGEYRVVRNAQSTVDLAVKVWREFIDDLRRDPCGDNFDFSMLRDMIGVVCTPFVVYSSDADTLAEAVPGLRRCASAGELHEWLGRS